VFGGCVYIDNILINLIRGSALLFRSVAIWFAIAEIVSTVLVSALSDSPALAARLTLEF